MFLWVCCRSAHTANMANEQSFTLNKNERKCLHSYSTPMTIKSLLNWKPNWPRWMQPCQLCFYMFNFAQTRPWQKQQDVQGFSQSQCNEGCQINKSVFCQLAGWENVTSLWPNSYDWFNKYWDLKWYRIIWWTLYKIMIHHQPTSTSILPESLRTSKKTNDLLEVTKFVPELTRTIAWTAHFENFQRNIHRNPQIWESTHSRHPWKKTMAN